jgi:hypothetical protein
LCSARPAPVKMVVRPSLLWPRACTFQPSRFDKVVHACHRPHPVLESQTRTDSRPVISAPRSRGNDVQVCPLSSIAKLKSRSRCRRWASLLGPGQGPGDQWFAYPNGDREIWEWGSLDELGRRESSEASRFSHGSYHWESRIRYARYLLPFWHSHFRLDVVRSLSNPELGENKQSFLPCWAQLKLDMNLWRSCTRSSQP